MPKADGLTFDLKTVLTLGGLLLAMAGAYYDLRQKANEACALAKAHERSLIELTTTLRVTGVIK
jgi:hypothetical protein